MRKYRLSNIEKIIYFLKNYLGFFVLFLTVGGLAQQNIDFFYRWQHQLLLVILIAPALIALYRLLNVPISIWVDDDHVEVREGTFIMHFKFSENVITTQSITSHSFIFIPVYRSKELHIVNMKTGKDEIFKIYGFNEKTYQALTEDLKRCQKETA